MAVENNQEFVEKVIQTAIGSYNLYEISNWEDAVIARKIMTESLLIPKSKFKIGDEVKWRGKKIYSIIEERVYSPDANVWAYLLNDMETYINEPYLESIERKEDDRT